MKVKMVWG